MRKINGERDTKVKRTINDKEKLSYLEKINEKYNKKKSVKKYNESENEKDKMRNIFFHKNENKTQQILIKNRIIKYKTYPRMNKNYNTNKIIQQNKFINSTKINLHFFYKNFLLLLYFIFIFNLFILINSKKTEFYQNRKLNSLNEITIKIKGKDTQNILYSEFRPQPNEIYVNENSTSYVIDEENKINGL